MQVCVRELRREEIPLLREFLYQAIFVPEGQRPPAPDILDTPEFQVYLQNFGEEPHDCAFAAVAGEKVVGAAWARVMEDFGHLFAGVPSLAIALLPEFRGGGMGTALLLGLLDGLRQRGEPGATLSVQRENRRAVGLYRKLGFEVAVEKEDEYILWKDLRGAEREEDAYAGRTL